VLAEHGGIGHAENFAPVRLAGSFEVGRIAEVKLSAFDEGRLIGVAA
jgi:hypothetical protein